MFCCQLCQRVVPPRTPCQRLVLIRRSKKYPYRPSANTLIRTNEQGKRKEHQTDDPGGQGQEIVKEVIVCPICAAQNGQH
jgi:hypothetical protein